MITFKKFLIEYLTDEQRKRFAHVSMTDKARADTDHFFGKGNDIVHGEISTDAGHQFHKSEVHRAVERHLGREIHHDDYRRGLIKDKYGREVKIGRLIKDEKLRNAFASDSTREGSRKGNTFKTTTVRGIEVAGQTNSAPDPHHPKGHSWAQLSCKNIDTGKNKKFLEHEIRHGTVVHRVHDHTGQEIYRATLQPHHNEEGHVAYVVDSEYGIKSPAFTRSAHEVAKKLSCEYKPGLFRKHPEVYSDNGIKYILHPKATHEDILRELNDENFNVRTAAIYHPNVNDKHLHKALNDKYLIVRSAAASHPNANAEHLHKALNDNHYYVRKAAASHPNANAEHLHRALYDEEISVREEAASHPNANAEHLHKALNDKNYNVRRAAIRNPNANAEHLHKALNDEHWIVREAAAKHRNANAEHLHKALNDYNTNVRAAAASNPNANAEHLHKALNDEDERVKKAAKENTNYKRYFQ
jgi:2-oxo-4-hydroxy-4-carboxy--5-ureidoimidazoline (OHCU) decarboxylase